jgi:CheY-like chemotaxis protein
VDSPPLRILVIDDSVDVREFLQLALESAGYETSVAADGREGLELMKSFRPDLVITDISMPGMSGFEFLVRVRSDLAPPVPPIMVVSGFDMTAEEALRLGAVCFLAKPVQPQVLLNIVAQVLRGEKPADVLLEREQEFVRDVRSRAAAAAARLVAQIDMQNPKLLAAFSRFTQWIADYFGESPAALALVDGGDIRVAGACRQTPVPIGTVLSGQALYSTGVLAAGCSLVLSDAGAFYSMMDPKSSQLGIRFLVAVPVLFDDVPVGAICMLDRAPHAFAAEDLLTLEHVGREATAGLRSGETDHHHIGENIGLVPPPLFDRMLSSELAIVHRHGGAFDLIIAEIDPAALHSELALELQAHGGPRLAVCRRAPGVVMIFKRDANADASMRGASEALAALENLTRVTSASWVSLVGPHLPVLSPPLLVQLAELALDDARSKPGAHTERIVLRRGDWPALAGHLAPA